MGSYDKRLWYFGGHKFPHIAMPNKELEKPSEIEAGKEQDNALLKMERVSEEKTMREAHGRQWKLDLLYGGRGEHRERSRERKMSRILVWSYKNSRFGGEHISTPGFSALILG